MSVNSCGPRAEVPMQFGNKTYIATKFDIARLVELERWMRRAPFEILNQTLAESNGAISAGMVKQMLANAWDKSQAMLLFAYEGRLFWMFSIEGITRALWLLLKPKHPELKWEDVLALAAPEDVDVYTNLIAEMMGHSPSKPYRTGDNAGSDDDDPEPRVMSLKHIYEALTREPYLWTPKQVGEMTMDEVDLAFVKDSDEGLSMDEMIEHARKRIESEKI